MRERILRLIADAAIQHPRRTVFIILLLTAAAAAVLPGKSIRAGHSQMMDQDLPHRLHFRQFLDDFGSPNQLIMLVEGGDEPLRREMVDALARDLPAPEKVSEARATCARDGGKNQPGCVLDVIGKIDIGTLTGRMLLYLPVAELKQLIEMLEGDVFGYETLLGVSGLASLFETFAESLESEEAAPEGEELEVAREMMDLVARFTNEITRRLKAP